jgi:hypothetical protein
MNKHHVARTNRINSPTDKPGLSSAYQKLTTELSCTITIRLKVQAYNSYALTSAYTEQACLAVKLQFRIRKVLGSNLGRDTGYSN